MYLKNKLFLLTMDNQSIFEYFQAIKCIIDDLALINSLISGDDVIIYALNGLRIDYKVIVATIRARENLLTFEEVLDKLVKQ